MRLLEDRLGVSRRRVNQLIAERETSLVLPREQAALALALENGIRIGRFATPDDYSALRQAASRPAVSGQPKQSRRQAPSAAPRRARTTKRRRGKQVFVVHGRNDELRKSAFRFLRALGLEPIEWSRALKAIGKGSPYVGEVLDVAFKQAVAVVVLLSPDDEAHLKTEYRNSSDPTYESRLTGQARPNVLFEAGMAFGSQPDATILVQVGEVRPFSDVAGRHVVHLDNRLESRRELASRLETAGCEIDISGSDWLVEGDFRI
jgi:predicted nucleotide-binding protein